MEYSIIHCHANCKFRPEILTICSTPDGIRFLRANIKVTKTGMCKITGDGILPLSVVSSEDIEVSFEFSFLKY